MPLEALRSAQSAVDSLDKGLNAPVEDAIEKPDGDVSYTPRLGDAVWLETLRAEGTIIELDKNEVVVQIGSLKVRARPNELTRPTRAEKKTLKRKHGSAYEKSAEITTPHVASPGLELDLRGTRVEDALEKLDSYIDAAYLSGLPFGRIIHGKGTGALRKAVQERLRDHTLISKVVPAPPKEGGDGVTIIYIASSTT